MSDYILNVAEEVSKLDWAFPFQRTGSFPLDRSSLFSTLADAEKYAAGLIEDVATDERALAGTSYVGQPISVYDAEKNSVDFYIIQPDRSLRAAGSALLGDDVTIEIVDGKIQLKGFGTNYYNKNNELVQGFKSGLQPRTKLVDGTADQFEIAWYEPSDLTIEGVNDTVSNLNQTVENLQRVVATNTGSIETLEEVVGTPAGENVDSTGLFAELDKKANVSDVYTKTEADKKIADAITAADHLSRKIVGSIKDIDVNAEDASKYIYMVSNGLTNDDDKYDEYVVIDGALEQVGSWEVDLSGYATTKAMAAALNQKVDKAEGKSLVDDDQIEKLTNLPANAEKNYISAVTEDFSVSDDGELALNSISIDKVTDLSNELAKKINNEDFSNLITTNRNSISGLLTEEQENKIALLNVKGEENYIKSVNEDQFTVIEGKLNLKPLAMSQVSGLSDLKTTVDNLDKILNGDGTEENVGLVATVNNFQDIYVTNSTFNNALSKLNNTYVTLTDFNQVVGNLDNLKLREESLSSQVDALDASVDTIVEMLTWKEMSE